LILLEPSDNAKQGEDWCLCAIFPPQLVTDSTTTRVSTLLMLKPLVKELFLITGNFPESALSSEKIQVINIRIGQYNEFHPPLWRSIPRFFIMQLKISYHLIKLSGKVDVVFLAGGAQTLLLPALTSKLLRKKLILSHLGLGASSRQDYRVLYGKTLFGMGKHVLPWLVERLEGFNCCLANRIAAFTTNADSPFLKKYVAKTSFGMSRFYVSTSSFKVQKESASREKLVGFIGRFDEMKGLLNLVKALPPVARECADIKFMIGGDGLLRSEVEKEIRDANLDDRVTLPGWIPHDKLPQYLNEIRLLVIPSYGETGPHVLFEAMACGTLVLATAVGVIPDVITDGETGFIMEDNSPECIAKNARKLIEREYTHQAAVERYRSILASLK